MSAFLSFSETLTGSQVTQGLGKLAEEIITLYWVGFQQSQHQELTPQLSMTGVHCTHQYFIALPNTEWLLDRGPSIRPQVKKGEEIQVQYLFVDVLKGVEDI